MVKPDPPTAISRTEISTLPLKHCRKSSRLLEMRRVLKGGGSTLLHCEDGAGDWLRTLMDAVFGVAAFRKDIDQLVFIVRAAQGTLRTVVEVGTAGSTPATSRHGHHVRLGPEC